MSEQGNELVKQEDDPAAQGSERRKHIRYRVSMPVYIRLTNGELVKARAVDISLGGVYVEYGAPADPGRIFEMMFDLPFVDSFKRVLVRAEVIRSVVVGGKDVHGIAFNFVEFARETDQILLKYLELRGLKQAV